MKVPVFRSLDRSNKLLGIKGSYIIYAVMGLGVAFFIGVTVGLIVHQAIIGTAVFLALGALMYMYLIKFQSEHDEKERDQMISSLSLPDNVSNTPTKIRHYFKTKFTFK